MTPATMAFSMSAGAATFAAVCGVLVLMPPLPLGTVSALVNIPVIVTAGIAFILRNVR